MATAQTNSATVGVVNAGMSGTANENVPKPVQLSSPTKISDPTPAASRPGTSTTPMSGPPSPAASINKKAPTMGDPNSVLIAAKLPAAAMTVIACRGESFLIRCTANTPSPLPMAINGASGPSTAPKVSVANAASAMPGSSMGETGPPDSNPAEGSCPPVPGRY